MHPLEVWLPHAMLLVKLGLIWHSECNLTPKDWTSWYTYLIVYMTHSIVYCIIPHLVVEIFNMPMIQKCFKSWSVQEEMENQTPTPPWRWQKTLTKHGPHAQPVLFDIPRIVTTGLPGGKQVRLMTSQAKVWKHLELSWGHNRKVTEHEQW